jgi:hypothetical protein
MGALTKKPMTPAAIRESQLLGREPMIWFGR